jgi:trimeric autotransporter adhesin
MRRFATLVVLLLFTIPFGISISGCSKTAAVVYCNGGDSGPVVGQLFSITLQPKLYGISLGYAEIGQVSTPAATDCKGTTVSVNAFSYGTTDMTLADVQPTTGRLCAGTWNRNTGGGIPDYTTCNATNKSGTAYITATANGASSNPIAVYIHPLVTSVVLGSPSTDCTNDPATNCSISPTTNQCVLTPLAETAVVNYTGTKCVSQGVTAQLAARVYSGTQNISCLAGSPTYTALDSKILTIDQNGVATAQAPGSTVITSNLSNAGSSAGFFATCPPQTITLSIPNNTSTNITVNQNFTQPITATVKDTNGVTLTGVNLAYISTTPTTLPSGGSASVTPIFPGAGTIVAVCQPPNCNSSPLNQIGLFGNGKQVVSNPINVTTPGTNSTVLYIASSQSLYLVPVDFTSTTIGAPVRLPYVPNSMVISNDGSTIYMGSSTELMTFSATTNAITKEDQSVSGTVLAVSPDNTTVVISDPVRQLIYLYGSSGSVQTSSGGVGTHAEFSPDSSTVYITAGNQLLVHSTFTGWSSITGSTVPSLGTPVSDVAVTVPYLGAFFGGATTTARGACPTTTVTTVSGLPGTTNVFYPDAGVAGPATDRLAATNDGQHVVGVTATPTATLTDLKVASLNVASQTPPTPPNPSTSPGQCPVDGSALKFTATPVSTPVIPGISAASITGVVPSSDSSNVFVTYTGTGGALPLYMPAANGPGTLSSVPLATYGSAAPIAPVAGVFSSDNTTFYTGTSGDNLVHILTKGSSGFVDTTTPIAPKLPAADGTIVTPNLLVQRPRKLT